MNMNMNGVAQGDSQERRREVGASAKSSEKKKSPFFFPVKIRSWKKEKKTKKKKKTTENTHSFYMYETVHTYQLKSRFADFVEIADTVSIILVREGDALRHPNGARDVHELPSGCGALECTVLTWTQGTHLCVRYTDHETTHTHTHSHTHTHTRTYTHTHAHNKE